MSLEKRIDAAIRESIGFVPIERLDEFDARLNRIIADVASLVNDYAETATQRTLRLVPDSPRSGGHE